MADVQSLYIEAERVYTLIKGCTARRSSASRNSNRPKITINYYRQKRELQQEILKQDTVSRAQQQQQDRNPMHAPRPSWPSLKTKVNGLIIVSPRDGQLTSSSEIGQSKTPGAPLGQLDVVDGFKVRLSDVDEHYITASLPARPAPLPSTIPL